MRWGASTGPVPSSSVSNGPPDPHVSAMLLHFRDAFQIILHRLDGYAGLAQPEHANGGGPLFCPCVTPLLGPHRFRFNGRQCGLQSKDFVVEFLSSRLTAFRVADGLAEPRPTLRRGSSLFE